VAVNAVGLVNVPLEATPSTHPVVYALLPPQSVKFTLIEDKEEQL